MIQFGRDDVRAVISTSETLERIISSLGRPDHATRNAGLISLATLDDPNRCGKASVFQAVAALLAFGKHDHIPVQLAVSRFRPDDVRAAISTPTTLGRIITKMHDANEDVRRYVLEILAASLEHGKLPRVALYLLSQFCVSGDSSGDLDPANTRKSPRDARRPRRGCTAIGPPDGCCFLCAWRVLH